MSARSAVALMGCLLPPAVQAMFRAERGEGPPWPNGCLERRPDGLRSVPACGAPPANAADEPRVLFERAPEGGEARRIRVLDREVRTAGDVSEPDEHGDETGFAA